MTGSNVLRHVLLMTAVGFSASIGAASRVYEIWEPEQAPDRGGDFGTVVMRGMP